MQNVTQRYRRLTFLYLLPYAALVTAAIHHHEPWADEAQSWLLARDSSLAHLWGTLLHYEGTPGLWQSLIHFLIALGLPYSAYNYVAGVLGLTAAWLLIRYAPLPLFLRLLLPFTYYLAYQYSVIARSYALIAPLLFAIAALYPQASRKPFRITLLLGLLAAVSVHGFLLSACIWITLYVPALLRSQNPERKKFAVAALTYCCVLVILLVYAWPAKDVAFAEHRSFSNLRLLPQITGAGIAGAFVAHWIPSLLLIALSIPFLWRGGGFIVFMLSTIALCLFGSIVYAQLWHFGILFLAWLFAIWISAQKTRLTRPALLAILGAIAVQCYWTASAIRYDWSHAYSGSRAAAQYLHGPRLPLGEIYAIGYSTVAIQPYFSSNIFSDYHGGSYWDWSRRNSSNDPQALVIAHPHDVLVGYKNLSEKQHWTDLLTLLGYTPAQHFDGATFWQTRAFEFESYDLYRQTATPRLTTRVNFLAGFYPVEGSTRWTAKNFSILLQAEPGEALVLHIFVPDAQIRNLGPITMTADLNGRALPAIAFPSSGQYAYTAALPPDALRAGVGVANFHLDQASVGVNGDARELGVIVTAVGFEPPSPAQ